MQNKYNFAIKWQAPLTGHHTCFVYASNERPHLSVTRSIFFFFWFRRVDRNECLKPCACVEKRFANEHKHKLWISSANVCLHYVAPRTRITNVIDLTHPHTHTQTICKQIERNEKLGANEKFESLSYSLFKRLHVMN